MAHNFNRDINDFCCQDSNEANDLPLLRDFTDGYTYSRSDFSPTSSASGDNIFNNKTPLPEISSAQGSRTSGSAQITSVFKKVSKKIVIFFRYFTKLFHCFFYANTVLAGSG